jgi:uncharacterized protein YjdB
LQLNSNVLPENASNQTLNWTVVNGTGSASVSVTGLVKAISNGTVTVNARSTDGSNISGNYALTLTNQTVVLVSSISITSVGNVNTISVPGGTLQLGASIFPSNASNKTIAWSIVNGTGSASVNASGLVQAISNGTITVVARSTDGSNKSNSVSGIITNQVVLKIAGNSETYEKTNVSQHEGLILYPNPASNEVFVSIPESSEGMNSGIVYIVNTAGKSLITKQMDFKTDAIIDLSSLAAGIYIVLVKVNDITYTKKLIHNQ